jgi:hypothetical protein
MCAEGTLQQHHDDRNRDFVFGQGHRTLQIHLTPIAAQIRFGQKLTDTDGDY